MASRPDAQERVDAWILAHPGATAGDAGADLGLSAAQVRQLASPHVRRRLVQVRPRSSTFTDTQALAALTSASVAIGGRPLSWARYEELVRSGQVEGPSGARVIQRFHTWADACRAAGIRSGAPPNRDYTTRWTDDDMLAMVVEYLADPAESGTYAGWDHWRARHRPEGPSAQTLRNRLGTWAQIKAQALRLDAAQP